MSLSLTYAQRKRRTRFVEGRGRRVWLEGKCEENKRESGKLTDYNNISGEWLDE